MIKDFEFKNTDTRLRRYVTPKKIVKTEGKVENAELLLEYRNRQIELNEPKVVTMFTEGENKAAILLDFGCEFHGGATVSVLSTGDAPFQKVRLCFGESVSEALSHVGEKGACNDHVARDYTVEMQRYSTNEYGNTGYRFLYIELLSEGKLTLATVQGIFVYEPLAYKGSFECSDETLNKIYDVSAYTCHLCIQNEIWDGIKRDRLIWVGDMSPEMKTIKYVWGDIPHFYRALALSAEAAPLPLWIDKMPTYSLWWLIILDEWCFYTGKKEYIDEQRDYIVPLTRQILDCIDENGVFTAGNFLDWPTKGFAASDAGVKGLTKMCLAACERMLTYLGEKALAGECEKKAEIFEGQKESCGGFKQVAAFLALNGLEDEECLATLKDGGAKGFSTFMSYYILKAMTKCCTTREILGALKEYYGAMLDMGATTFWEDFDIDWVENACPIDEIPDGTRSDIHGDNGKYCYLGFRHSLCHGWSSGPVPFLTEYVLGIEILEEGCKAVKVTPHLGELTYAKGSIATPFGKLEVEHTKNNDGIINTVVNAPEDIRIEF